MEGEILGKIVAEERELEDTNSGRWGQTGAGGNGRQSAAQRVETDAAGNKGYDVL